MIDWLRRKLWGRRPEEIKLEVTQEPEMIEAQDAIKRANRILWELQMIERRRKPRIKGGVWNH